MSEKIAIFIPVYFREDTVKKSAESILATYQSTGFDVSIVFVDNKSNDTLRQYLMSLIPRGQIQVILLDGNIGKAKAITHATKKFPKFDWFISCDSDIITYTKEWPGLLVECYRAIPSAGMVSPEYVRNANHPMPPQPQHMPLTIRGKPMTFHWGAGVAGGCFVTHRSVWTEIGYKNVGVYGGVDGLFRQKVADIMKRKCGWVEGIVIEHYDDRAETEGYYEWKVRVQDNIRKFSIMGDPKKIGNDKGFWG